MKNVVITGSTRGIGLCMAKELKDTSVLAIRLSPGMMLTDFITKTPDGDESQVLKDKWFISIFNTLADKPETVAKFLISRILSSTKNNWHIVWLTNMKVMWRFISAPFIKRKLISIP